MTKKHDIYWFLRPTLLAVLCILLSLICANMLVEDDNEHALAPEKQSAEQLATAIKSIVYPRPDISPAEVVGLQLAGLSDRQSARGILQCMMFASPLNRSVNGPLERFGRMVRTRPFDVLSHPDRVLIGKTKYVDGKARVLVTLVVDTELSSFVWVLSKQAEPPFENCWMTDAVFPLTFDNADADGSELQRLDAV